MARQMSKLLTVRALIEALARCNPEAETPVTALQEVVVRDLDGPHREVQFDFGPGRRRIASCHCASCSSPPALCECRKR